MLKDGSGQALASWLALLVVAIVAAAAIGVWLQPDVFNRSSCAIHEPGTAPPLSGSPFCK